MPEVLNTNIQELIDMEQMMGINATQSEPGQRTSKYNYFFLRILIKRTLNLRKIRWRYERKVV